MNRQRLLNVALALRESPSPEHFGMWAFFRDGWPADPLGHYAVRSDLQSVWGLDTFSDTGMSCVAPEVLQHFEISEAEAGRLFAFGGCDRAKTALAAAEYIERFACS
jgi:hypothetical protein